MYEYLTDRARKVMALANQEAQRFNHEYVGPEHILLGLVKEWSGIGANVLKNLDIDPRKVRLGVEMLIKSRPDMVTVGKLPQTPRAKKVIEYAIEEARSLNHNYVGTEHLLLGLLREQDNSVAAQVLMNLGLKLEEVREKMLNLLGVKPTRCIYERDAMSTSIMYDEKYSHAAIYSESGGGFIGDQFTVRGRDEAEDFLDWLRLRYPDFGDLHILARLDKFRDEMAVETYAGFRCIHCKEPCGDTIIETRKLQNGRFRDFWTCPNCGHVGDDTDFDDVLICQMCDKIVCDADERFDGRAEHVKCFADDEESEDAA